MIQKNVVVLLLAFALLLFGTAFAAPTSALAHDGVTARGFLINK